MATLFFSYSHRDEDLRNELEVHLAPLKRQGLISVWHDRRIDAGGDIHGEISDSLETADIVLLLVSPHFLASDYCQDREMSRALERERKGECVVIPVFLKPCDWKSAPFGHLRGTPNDAKSVVMFANQDEGLAIVAGDVRRVAEKLAKAARGANQAPRVAPLAAASGATVEVRSSNLRVKRKFSDRERDVFLQASFEYMARYFEGSLDELVKRNQKFERNFTRLDARSFTASIYEDGRRVATCAIWYTLGSRGNGVAYSNSGEAAGNSFNESLSVEDDGYILFLRPLGLATFGTKEKLGQEGAAEYYWSLLLRPLQD